MEHPRHGHVEQLLAFISNLLVHDAVEYENEEALRGVENGKDVGDRDGGVGDGQDAHRPGGTQEEEQAEEAFHIQFQRCCSGLVCYQSIPAVDVDLPDSNRQEVYVDTDDAEDRSQEGENEMDVAFDPAEVSTAIHSDIVEQGVNKQGEENHEEGCNVAKHVVLNVSRVVRLENLNKENIDLEPCNEHPEEGGKEEIVEDDGDHRAGRWEVSLTDAKKKDEFCNKKTDAEVGVDRGAVILGTPERGEDSNADDKADQADGASNVGEDVESALVLLGSGEPVHVHKNSKVGQVVALT